MAIEHFEVYYYQNGRWHVHARFEAEEREIAIEETKSVETNLGYPARVIRETFYPESNTTEEVVTFQGNRAKKISDSDTMFGSGEQGGSSSGAGRAGAGQSSKAGSSRSGSRQSTRAPNKGGRQQTTKKDDRKQKQHTRRKAKSAIVTILTGFALSLLAAVIGSLAVTMILFQMVEAGVVPNENRNPLLLGTFVLLFFGTFFLHINKHFNLMRFFKKKKKEEKRGPAPKTVPLKQNSQRKPVPTDAADLANADIDELAKRVKNDEANEELKAASLDDDGFDSGKTNSDPRESKKKETAKKDEKKDEKKEKDSKKKEQLQKKKEAEQKLKKDEDKRKASQKKKAKSPADIVKPEFLKFLTDAVTSIQREHPQLNTFSKFGMNLYLSGACTTICQAKGLSNEAMLTLLKDGLGLIGTNAARAQSFCDDIPTYGNNPRYASMIQAGGQAMANLMGGHANANSVLSGLLTEWNLPEKRSAVPNMFTFLFTDIVGSTAMTQRLGNAGAQKAVRAHNDAVRGAIQQFNGREVKHTGDGIMATFPDGPSAVAASVQMLQGVVAHNQATPDIPVEIRVGVNTGEAVEEENDFFGQAVQMTARICDKAADGHAWVSEIVVQACQGQKFKFIPRGEFEMKGIEKPKPLFEIAWNDAHRDEIADL